MPDIEKNTCELSLNKLAQIKRDAQEALDGQIKRRNFYDYIIRLNLNEDDLREKSILDVGAGEANFAKQAKMKGISVTALDTIYSLKEGRERFRNISLEGYLPDAVAGTTQEMPFKNEKFDLLTYMFSSFYYAKSEEDLRDGLNEGLRVLKKGGKMMIYPCWRPDFKEVVLMVKENDNLEKVFH
jgi:ubiquinone/menaquinone biosynthesis C-methylase UbiE